MASPKVATVPDGCDNASGLDTVYVTNDPHAPRVVPDPASVEPRSALTGDTVELGR